jgi:hypothetical protein
VLHIRGEATLAPSEESLLTEHELVGRPRVHDHQHVDRSKWRRFLQGWISVALPAEICHPLEIDGGLDDNRGNLAAS